MEAPKLKRGVGQPTPDSEATHSAVSRDVLRCYRRWPVTQPTPTRHYAAPAKGGIPRLRTIPVSEGVVLC